MTQHTHQQTQRAPPLPDNEQLIQKDVVPRPPPLKTTDFAHKYSQMADLYYSTEALLQFQIKRSASVQYSSTRRLARVIITRQYLSCFWCCETHRLQVVVFLYEKLRVVFLHESKEVPEQFLHLCHFGRCECRLRQQLWQTHCHHRRCKTVGNVTETKKRA